MDHSNESVEDAVASTPPEKSVSFTKASLHERATAVRNEFLLLEVESAEEKAKGGHST